MMPNDVAAQESHDVERVNAQAMNSYHSVWMAHWKQTSYKSTTPLCNRLTIDCEPKEVKEDSEAEQRDLLGGLEEDDSLQAGAFVESARAATVPFINETDARKSKEANIGSKSFPLFSLSVQREHNGVYRGKDGKSETKACSGEENVSLNKARSYLPSTSEHALPKTKPLVGECQILSQGVLQTGQLMKSSCAADEKNPAVSTSLWNDFSKSAFDIVPTGLDKGKTVMSRFACGPREIYQSSYNSAPQESFISTKYRYSSLLICEKKMSSLLDSRRSSFSRWMQGGISHLPHDPIAGSDDGLYFVCGQHHEFEDYTANPNIRNQIASFESTKPKKVYGVSSMLAKVPRSVHDTETMKLYTSIGSVEESSRGHPKISQTTHHFLMSKKADVNSSDRGQFFREPIAPTKMKDNSFNEILEFPPQTSDNASESWKLEALETFIKNEGKENVQDFKCPTSLKNESSAETDIMDIDALHENNLSGDVSLQTNKCSKDSRNSLTSQVAATTSAREKSIAKSVNTVLPDINQEPIEPLPQASPVVDRENSTSRTHSLDVEHLFSHADEHARSKTSSSSLGPDPSSRWVKRLKLCTLGSAHGTESVKIGETSSHKKENNIFSKIVEHSKTSLESKMGYQAEGQVVPDLPATVLINGKSSLTEAKKTVEITLSHPWIQRWSHSRAASSQNRLQLTELHESPKPSNTVLEEFQKKQFPSIAAMALMGKAVNSLNHSELMKKGPVIVWNTKAF